MVASVPEEMTCDVHDRGRERYLHGTRPPTQRVLRRRLLRDPDANGRRTLRVGETAGPDLSGHAPEFRLTLGLVAALRQTTAPSAASWLAGGLGGAIGTAPPLH